MDVSLIGSLVQVYELEPIPDPGIYVFEPGASLYISYTHPRSVIQFSNDKKTFRMRTYHFGVLFVYH